jgi:hypothetical protein
MPDRTCRYSHDLTAELALGVLRNRDTSRALAHVRRCPRCFHQLADLLVVTDRLLGLTPVAEPPPGFETRLLSHLMRRSPPTDGPTCDGQSRAQPTG